MSIRTSAEVISTALRILGIGVLTLSLSACDLVATLVKEAAVSATSRRGWDTFTFKGQLPAEFGIDAIAFYSPHEPGKASCQTQSFEPGKTITRRHTQRYTAEIQAQPQAFSFEIPLSYYKGLCGMRLGRVKLEINVRYGKEKWQKTYADGNFLISQNGTDKTFSFGKVNTINVNADCSFTFKESSLNVGIDKLMRCRSARLELDKTELANKTVHLNINVSTEERPYYDQTWIKFDNGWKPCLPKEGGWIKCQSPPVFKTFEMNGQTCTVYPNCKEQ
ncbi:hypothetical protein [Pseudomonas viridiflava]|uniref:hypothetical protein n=2 Tax=Pseudomonas viridiflava TaxID=33069 RepID=UPI0013C342D0|nr:hypothetical protein [Pseudomonas viridiflava]